MAVRTDWFIKEGGFDESFVNGFEDVDLCMRARAQNRAIAYLPQSRFAHYEAASAGRFDREAQNERRFYERWSTSLESLPRTVRGAVGAIAMRSPCGPGSLLAAAHDDLEAALRAFGHPVVHGGVPLWSLVDRRFRRAANLGWFSDEVAMPGIAIARRGDATVISTHGSASLEVPWLPCVSDKRVARLGIRRSEDRSCTSIGMVGNDEALAADLAARGYHPIRVTAGMLLGEGNWQLACAVHLGLTDQSSFGNVLLAQAGIPAVVLPTTELRALFADDVALVCERDAMAEAVARFVGDPSLRARYGKVAAADARRRFSPRRSAIRVVDLLCAARFGLERPQSGGP
jgi:hypothetical protein